MAKRLALISVFDKTGMVDFARELSALDFEIISSGGTFKALQDAGISVKRVEEITGFSEMLDGRVKTLQPAIHAGILADRRKKEHLQQLEERNIKPIDLVVVNLYPFKQTIAKPNVPIEEIIENIDIGGPALVRSAAKNFESVAVATSPSQYAKLIGELKQSGSVSPETRKELAAKAFEEIAAYDALISKFFHEMRGKEFFPEKLSLTFEKLQECRYGENPHLKGALYKEPLFAEPSIVNAKQLHGKELSFNNFLDANSTVELAKEFSAPTAVIVKHNNPCGVASAEKLSKAFKRALDCDPKSAFGGVIALNDKCDEATAKLIASFFNEVVIAPAFDANALEILKKKKDLRVLLLEGLGKKARLNEIELKSVVGGVLVQERNLHELKEQDLKNVTKRKPTAKQISDLLFAWKVAKYVKSNAIVLAKNSATIGIGAGQMSRIDSLEISAKKAGKKSKGSVLASDGFFPFEDNIIAAAKAGIKAIIEPGGSIRDKQIIEAADKKKIAMVFSGIRQFRH